MECIQHASAAAGIILLPAASASRVPAGTVPGGGTGWWLWGGQSFL